MSDPRDTLAPPNQPGEQAGPGEPDEPGAQRPPASEPRVSDLLAGRVTPEASEELDPATVAQLAAWFGIPVATPVPDPSATPPSKREEAALRRQQALDAVDPAFLAAHEARWAQGDALLRINRPVGRRARSPSRFDLAAWKLHASDEVREAERPEDVSDALKEPPTPQAVLRDLHRPDQQFLLRLLPTDVGMDVAGMRTRSRIDTLLRTSYAVRMDDEPIPARLMLEDMAALRAHLGEPWESFYVPPEKRRGPATLVPTAEDFKWFGMTGFDPDL